MVVSAATLTRARYLANGIAAYYTPRQWLTLAWAAPMALCVAHLGVQFIYFLSDLHVQG